MSHVVQDDRASSCFDHVGGNTPSVAVVRGCRGIRSSTLKTETELKLLGGVGLAFFFKKICKKK